MAVLQWGVGWVNLIKIREKRLFNQHSNFRIILLIYIYSILKHVFKYIFIKTQSIVNLIIMTIMNILSYCLYFLSFQSRWTYSYNDLNNFQRAGQKPFTILLPLLLNRSSPFILFLSVYFLKYGHQFFCIVCRLSGGSA